MASTNPWSELLRNYGGTDPNATPIPGDEAWTPPLDQNAAASQWLTRFGVSGAPSNFLDQWDQYARANGINSYNAYTDPGVLAQFQNWTQQNYPQVAAQVNALAAPGSQYQQQVAHLAADAQTPFGQALTLGKYMVPFVAAPLAAGAISGALASGAGAGAAGAAGAASTSALPATGTMGLGTAAGETAAGGGSMDLSSVLGIGSGGSSVVTDPTLAALTSGGGSLVSDPTLAALLGEGTGAASGSFPLGSGLYGMGVDSAGNLVGTAAGGVSGDPLSFLGAAGTSGGSSLLSDLSSLGNSPIGSSLSKLLFGSGGLSGSLSSLFPNGLLNTAATETPGLLALNYAANQTPIDTSGLQNVINQLSGNQNAVIKAATDPLQQNIAAGYGDLTQSLAARGVLGSSFGNTDIANYLATTGNALSNAGATAAEQSLGLQGSLSSNVAQLNAASQQMKNSLYGRAFDILGRGLSGSPYAWIGSTGS